jgi:hypothetical protein
MMLKKLQVQKFVDEYKGSLYVEKFLQSKPYQYLKVLTTKGPVNLGAVPKSIYRWFELEPMTQQPGYINVIWFKFKVIK